MKTFLKALWIKMNATKEANISSVNLGVQDIEKSANEDRPGDVADQGAGIEGHQQEKDDRHPDANPEAQAQIVPLVGLAQLEEDLLKDVDGASGAEQVERLPGKE